MTSSRRFTSDHVQTWRRDGGVLIERFFTEEEVASVVSDFDAVFGQRRGADDALVAEREDGDEEAVGAFNDAQFASFEAVPFDCSPALNLIGVHPALVAFARDALGTDKVHLYQCQAWAKYTGDADYDQPFHCDFVNHTLTVPSECDEGINSVTILCYFTDVTEGHGPMHYVTRPDSRSVGVNTEDTLRRETDDNLNLDARLSPLERSSASPAGSIFAYGIDVYHRGTNLTAPGGRRYAVMACFKRGGNDVIGYHAWQYHHRKPWSRIFDHATPDQLGCFGVPLPGDPFWTDEALRGAAVRYPGWDLEPYRAAMTSSTGSR